MIRLLIDTHILIALFERRLERLHRTIHDALQLSSASSCVSVVSLWEIAIKVRIGKLPLDGPLAGLPDLVRSLGLTLLVIKASHVLAEVDPLTATRDPFDRLLLAQCHVEICASSRLTGLSPRIRLPGGPADCAGVGRPMRHLAHA